MEEIAPSAPRSRTVRLSYRSGRAQAPKTLSIRAKLGPSGLPVPAIPGGYSGVADIKSDVPGSEEGRW